MAQRVEPDVEARHGARVVGRVEEAYLVYRGLILHVAVGILEGVDAVGHRLEVLGDEDAVLLGTGDDVGLMLEHRRVPLHGLLDRVGDEEPDEALAHRVGLVGVGRVARHIHRVDLGACREDVAHGVQRAALVGVLDGRAEVDGVGGVGLQRILDRYDNATTTTCHRRLLFHHRRGVELLLLILDLHILVELDIYLRRVQRVDHRGEVIGLHGDNHRRQGILRASRGCHRGGTLGEECRHEQHDEECRQ